MPLLAEGSLSGSHHNLAQSGMRTRTASEDTAAEGVSLDGGDVVGYWLSTELLTVLDGLVERVFLVDGDGALAWRNHAAKSAGPADAVVMREDPQLAPHMPVLAELMSARGKHTNAAISPKPRRRVRVLPISAFVAGAPTPHLHSAVLIFLPPQPDDAAQRAEDRLAVLTPVERSLVMAVVGGASMRDAADHLGISYHTARKYMQRIYSKLEVRGQADLLRKLSRLDLNV